MSGLGDGTERDVLAEWSAGLPEGVYGLLCGLLVKAVETQTTPEGALAYAEHGIVHRALDPLCPRRDSVIACEAESVLLTARPQCTELARRIQNASQRDTKKFLAYWQEWLNTRLPAIPSPRPHALETWPQVLPTRELPGADGNPGTWQSCQLTCPRCAPGHGGDYVHLERVRVLEGVRETEIGDDNVYVRPYKNPRGGSSVEITAFCEFGHRFALVFQFHKGNTYVSISILVDCERTQDGQPMFPPALWRD